MLNAYFAATVPAVVEPYGGDVDRIVGDALMVTFNKRGDQPDHARRAAGAGLALQAAARRVHVDHPDWPQFRVGVNSGPWPSACSAPPGDAPTPSSATW